jgi:hypothetical protein
MPSRIGGRDTFSCSLSQGSYIEEQMQASHTNREPEAESIEYLQVPFLFAHPPLLLLLTVRNRILRSRILSPVKLLCLLPSYFVEECCTSRKYQTISRIKNL